jgi:hypothetical protein
MNAERPAVFLVEPRGEEPRRRRVRRGVADEECGNPGLFSRRLPLDFFHDEFLFAPY